MEEREEPGEARLTQRLELPRVTEERLVRALQPAPDAVLGRVELPASGDEFHYVRAIRSQV